MAHLHGTSRDDILVGSDGDDTIEAGRGHDLMFADRVPFDNRGGNDNDVLYGGAGDDLLSGGAGTDLFLFGATGVAPEPFGSDSITDFTVGERVRFLSPGTTVALGIGRSVVVIVAGDGQLLGTLTATNGHLWAQQDFILAA